MGGVGEDNSEDTDDPYRIEPTPALLEVIDLPVDLTNSPKLAWTTSIPSHFQPSFRQGRERPNHEYKRLGKVDLAG